MSHLNFIENGISDFVSYDFTNIKKKGFVINIENPGIYGSVWGGKNPIITGTGDILLYVVKNPGSSSQTGKITSNTTTITITDPVIYENFLINGTNTAPALYGNNLTMSGDKTYFVFTWDDIMKDFNVVQYDNIKILYELNIIPTPCFSGKTFIKITQNISSGIICVSRAKRYNKKMYRCEYKHYGTIEFTEDHLFKYQGKYYVFSELIKIHPILKKTAREIPLDDPECGYNSYIYNIYNISQFNEPMYSLGSELYMFGGFLGNSYKHVLQKLTIFKKIIKKNSDMIYTNYIFDRKSVENFVKSKIIENNTIDFDFIFL